MISEEKLNLIGSNTYTFGGFQLEAKNLLLLKNSEVVPLAPKAIEVLLSLIEANGKLITKQELLDKVWAKTFVEEANLTHHISALRKALGEDKNGRKFIETIPRRGYRFVAAVSEINQAQSQTVEIVVSRRITEKLIEETEIETDNRLFPTHLATIGAADRRLTGNKKLIVAAGIILLMAILGLVLYGFVRRRENDTARRASLQPINYMRVSDRNSGSANISPDGKFVAYIQNYSDLGGGTLFIKQLETNREIRLLEPDERTFGDVNFSPDGSLIYYVSYEKNAKTGALFSIPILGGIPKRLFDLDASSACFAVSPDGKQIAFYRTDAQNEHKILLIVAPIDNANRETERVLLTQNDSEMHYYDFLAWSPDGRFLAIKNPPTSEMKHDAQLFRYDLQTGEVSRLSDQNFADIGKMRYGSDGRELYFIAEDEFAYQKIYALDLQNHQIRLISSDSNYYGNYGLGITNDGKTLAADMFESRGDLWSAAANGVTANAICIKRGTSNGKRGIAALPDGSIAYIARTGSKFDVWKTTPGDAGNALPLTNDSFKEKDLTASADGRFLVFSSDRTSDENDKNTRHLFRINAADGGDLKQLTFGETIDRQPDFSPDGNWLIYTSEQNGKSIIKKISSDGGTSRTITDENAYNPVFSPDGSQIAFKILSDVRSQPGKLVVIAADSGKREKVFPVAEFEHPTVLIPFRWTPDGTGLIFRREANGVGNLWQQNLDNSPPRQLTDFTSDTIFNFVYSTNGKQMLLSRGIYQNNPVLIQNF